MRKSITRPFGLPKRERLRRRKDLQRVYKSSFRVGCQGSRIILSENDLPWNRVAFTTSREIKGAVKRNREKRIFRELFRMRKRSLKKGYDIIFVLYPGEYTFHEREMQFESLFQKAGLLR
jgi:ribonuclease P protein component